MNIDFESKTEIKICEKHGEYESNSFSITGKNIYWTGCPTCDAEEEQKKLKAEEQHRQNLAEDARKRDLIAMQIPKRYHGVKLNSFIAEQNQERAYRAAQRFVDNFSTEKSQVLIFAGTTGTGKTMLSSAIMQTLWTGWYLRAVDIGRLVRDTYGNRDLSEKDVVDSIVDSPLLVIDEVGVQSGTDNEVMLITDIIDRRYSELKSTIIVSNLSTEKLAITFGERAWDRIKQDAVYEPVTGDSMRSKS